MEFMTRQEINEAVARRSAEDPAFRGRLMADPHAVLGELVGYPIPRIVNISVHEESLTDIHLVLAPAADELSEADLALVAGGVDWAGCTGLRSL